MESLFFMVEVTGVEPAASWSQTKHSTKLSYTSFLFFVPDYYIISNDELSIAF